MARPAGLVTIVIIVRLSMAGAADVAAAVHNTLQKRPQHQAGAASS